MKSIYDITEQDEQEISLCWCGKGYYGHSEEHSKAIYLQDRIYLIMRDSWGKNQPLRDTAGEILEVMLAQVERVYKRGL